MYWTRRESTSSPTTLPRGLSTSRLRTSCPSNGAGACPAFGGPTGPVKPSLESPDWPLPPLFASAALLDRRGLQGGGAFVVGQPGRLGAGVSRSSGEGGDGREAGARRTAVISPPGSPLPARPSLDRRRSLPCHEQARSPSAHGRAWSPDCPGSPRCEAQESFSVTFRSGPCRAARRRRRRLSVLSHDRSRSAACCACHTGAAPCSRRRSLR